MDAGIKDLNGYISVMSRTDDVINVAGHRLSCGHIEEVCGSTCRKTKGFMIKSCNYKSFSLNTNKIVFKSYFNCLLFFNFDCCFSKAYILLTLF